MGSPDNAAHPAGLHRLPLRVRDTSGVQPHKANNSITFGSSNSSNKDDPPARFKHCPESLHLPLHGNARIRSPTESSMSTLSSVPDSATTGSLSTVASPLSSSYASDLNDMFPGSRPVSRILHRHQASSGTCSTFVNDEDDASVVAGYPNFNDKIGPLDALDIRPSSREGDETLPVSPSTEAPPVKEEELPDARLTFYEESPPCETPPTPQKWETQSTASDDCTHDDAESILDYALQLAYGIDIHDTSVAPAESRRVVQKFIRELGQTIWHAAPENTQGTNNPISGSNSNSSTPGNSGTGESQRGGKRKKQSGGTGGGRGGEDEGDEFTDGDGEGYLPVKKPRPNPKDEDNLRLSCPFRKRNPQRFNVRDHHSCAMTFFPKFAELRQHIVKQHKRDDPSAFVCSRCNRDFATRKELHIHQRLPREQICEISDHDPESGIDGSTSTKLLSRKRASGTSPDVQWREIWNILFPEDDDHLVPPYHFTPVIEHFELSNSYLASFEFLRSSLRDKMSNPATLETLATKFHQCFVEAMERCIGEAQNMPYANRSNKRGEQLAAAANAAAAQPRTSKDVLPRPDSGVVITDDGSDESGSVMGTSSLNHKESVKTVRGPHRGSNLSSTARDIAPARTSSAVFDPSFPMPPASTSTPMTVSSGSVAPTEIDSWSQGVIFSGQGMPDGFGVYPQDLSLPHDLSTFPQSFYDASSSTRGMGNDFTGYF